MARLTKDEASAMSAIEKLCADARNLLAVWFVRKSFYGLIAIGLLGAAYVNLGFVGVAGKLTEWFSLSQEPSIWIGFVCPTKCEFDVFWANVLHPKVILRYAPVGSKGFIDDVPITYLAAVVTNYCVNMIV